MTNKILLLLSILLFTNLICTQPTFAGRTTPIFFTATLGEINAVVTNGGNTSSAINDATGALSSSLTPAFIIITNSNSKSLTMSASADSQGGTQNAIFNISTVRYIILTNSNSLPPVSSLTNIKTGSPTPSGNPNAIAYVINDPVGISGKLAVTYSSGNKNWNLALTNRGQTPTSITVPSANPLNNTFSSDDEAGSYQADITLSFNP